MELAFIVWMLGTLSDIAPALCIISFIGLVVGLFGYYSCRFINVCGHNESEKEQAGIMSKMFRPVAIVFGIIWVTTLMIPDKQTAWQMFAVYGVQSVAENEQVQQLARDRLEVLQALMKQAKEEINKESK